MEKRKIIVICAPSGAGKTTIVRQVSILLPQLQFLTSATTRLPRPHEEHGKDYFFISTEEFQRMIHDNELLEYEEVYPGTFYGTPRAELEIDAGPAILDLDVLGALNVQKLFPDRSMTLFVKPPSIQELERRLRLRGTESDDAIQPRLKRAKEEMDYANRFDAVIVNDDLRVAVATAEQMIRNFLCH